jgi:hypothetical protein
VGGSDYIVTGNLAVRALDTRRREMGDTLLSPRKVMLDPGQDATAALKGNEADRVDAKKARVHLVAET